MKNVSTYLKDKIEQKTHNRTKANEDAATVPDGDKRTGLLIGDDGIEKLKR